MLDDFRKEAGDGGIFKEDDSVDFDDYGEFEEEEEGEEENEKPIVLKDNRPKGPFLGLTAAQRLFLSIMLLALSCVLSTACLVVTGSMRPF